jgi:DNA-directed RNA polymerase specialized sigma24 family protein
MDALPITRAVMDFVRGSMSDGRPGQRISEKSDVGLLSQLKTPDAWLAWKEILNRHASLIMKTASQFEFQQERKNECFLFVCEKLTDNGFRRLHKYDAGRNASFRTWLVAIVFNLCIDWHRKEFGRAVLLPAISALPVFDQLVFRYSFEQAMSSQECLQALSTEFPDVTDQQLHRAIRRVQGVLTARQRWQIGVRYRRKRQSGNPRIGQQLPNVDQLPSPTQDPAVSAQKQQELDALRSALSNLPARQQLLLHLRFHAGLTLDQIAQFLQLGDSARAWRQIDKALKALSDQFTSKKFPDFREK